jgi:hypothetical protein
MTRKFGANPFNETLKRKIKEGDIPELGLTKG